MKPFQYRDSFGYLYGIRIINADKTSYGGFVNLTAEGDVISAPDFNKNKECGGGIHFWPLGIGIGDGKQANYKGCIWQVVKAKSPIIGLEGGKAKCKSVKVVYSGDWQECIRIILPERLAYLESKKNKSKSFLEYSTSDNSSSSAASGEYSAAVSFGYKSAAAASGSHSSAVSFGDHSSSTATGRASSSAAQGYHSTAASSGDGCSAATYSTRSVAAASGWGGAAAAQGKYSIAAASGYYSVSTSSESASVAATTGRYCLAEATGLASVAVCAGFDGRAMAGDGGVIVMSYGDEFGGIKFAIGIVGKNIKPKTLYKVTNSGEFVEVENG